MVGVMKKMLLSALLLCLCANAPATEFADSGEKRVALHLLRDIGAEHLLGAFNDAITANLTSAELGALDARLQEFSKQKLLGGQ
jgi:hypothetical protein